MSQQSLKNATVELLEQKMGRDMSLNRAGPAHLLLAVCMGGFWGNTQSCGTPPFSSIEEKVLDQSDSDNCPTCHVDVRKGRP